MPVSAQPGGTGFSSQDVAIQHPPCAWKFETLSDNLLATAFDHATSDQVACSAKLIIAHAFEIVAVVGQGLFCQVGFLCQHLAGFNNWFDSSLPQIFGDDSQPGLTFRQIGEDFYGNAVEAICGMIPVHNLNGVRKVECN